MTRTLGDPAETVVIGCTVTGRGRDRTCTAPGPNPLPVNQLVYMRITVTGGGADLDRAYWGVSVEP